MGELVSIGSRRVFTLAQARALLPVVRRITRRARTRYQALQARLGATPQSVEQVVTLEQAIHEVVAEWTERIERLGCTARGLWTVDFDSGTGFFCWRYPEDDIAYFHGYDDGFAGRTPLRT